MGTIIHRLDDGSNQVNTKNHVRISNFETSHGIDYQRLIDSVEVIRKRFNN